jgi:hypothetical protein
MIARMMFANVVFIKYLTISSGRLVITDFFHKYQGLAIFE